MDQNNFNDLIVTHRLPNGNRYKWTLVSRLGDMLNMAEDLLGPRNMCYTILGVEFLNDRNYGQIWCPGDCKHIAIQLPMSIANNTMQTYHHLAHETVHLLSPTGGSNANYFEEGVACYFADYYMKKAMNWVSNYPLSPQSYVRALELLTPQLHDDVTCIRKLREKEPSFSQMSSELINTEFPNLTLQQVDFLLSTFERNSVQ